MQNLAKVKFISFATKLPTDWKQPQGEAGKQYTRAFKMTELVGMPPVPPMFVPATVNKYHTDTAKKIGDQFATYLDGICSAICSAWSQWQSMAAMSGIMVNAVTATLGQVVGPPWLPLDGLSGNHQGARFALVSSICSISRTDGATDA